MSVVKFEVVKWKGQKAVGGKQKYTLTGYAEAEPGDTVASILFSSLLPQKYAPVPGDRRAVCKSVDVDKRDGSLTIWDVTAEFDTEPVSEKDKAKDSNERPTERPVVIEYSYEEEIEILDKDFSPTPKAIVTANDEPLDPGIENPISITVVRITRCEETYDPKKMAEYANTTNAEAFGPWGADEGLMKAPVATSKTEGEITYFEVKYEMRFRTDEKKWKSRPLHRGYKVKIDSKQVKAADDYGREESSPVLLKADGTRLEPNGTPHYLEFIRFKSKSWSPLGLTS